MPSDAISKIAARLHKSAQRPGRFTLFLYVILVTCPIRYWPMQDGIDPTWRYALNYAGALGSAAGSDVVFTMGPLSYLTFPQMVGDNLTRGLLFQAGLWLVLIAIVFDLFFRAGFRLRNLAVFTFCLELAAPMFWLNATGVENLMLVGAFLLLVLFHFHGSWPRYLVALVLIGSLPLFKLSAAVIGLPALAGFLLERVIQRGSKARLEVAAGILVPAVVCTALLSSVMPSLSTALATLRGSLIIADGYSAAMSLAGPEIELWFAAAALAVLAALVWSQSDRRFFVLLLSLPVFISFKHGFVRQDMHIISYFCFIALAIALLTLTADLTRRTKFRLPLLAAFFGIWLFNVGHFQPWEFIDNLRGQRNAALIVGVLAFDQMKPILEPSLKSIPEDKRIEEELTAIIGVSTVASLSVDFTNLAAAQLNLRLYPVVQRYSAYSPYLDKLNAAWIRDHGPRFLLFDGEAIDHRDAWAETPAMWLEVYRWYNTRLLGPRNLLLERRAGPRFTRLEPIDRFTMSFDAELKLPDASGDVFWTRRCAYSLSGQLRKFLYRDPVVTMSVHEKNGHTRRARILPSVLVSPIVGNALPRNLKQFSALFDPAAEKTHAVESLVFLPGGSDSFAPTCEVELSRPVQ